MKENEHIKIQGICGKGFWLRFFVDGKQRAEEWINWNAPFNWQFLDAKLSELVGLGRVYSENADKFEGSLLIYKDIKGKASGFPLAAIETFVEHYYPDIELDNVVSSIYSAQNKCYAILALFESIVADLETVALEHFDDNSKELALAVKERFEKLHGAFDEKVFEPLGTNLRPLSNFHESLSGALYRLVRDHHQVMVIPELRRTWIEDVLGSEKNMTDKERADEAQEAVDYVREQFELSSHWK